MVQLEWQVIPFVAKLQTKDRSLPCSLPSENAELMQEEIKRQPCMIERLYGELHVRTQEALFISLHCMSTVCVLFSLTALITDLYMDRASFKVH